MVTVFDSLHRVVLYTVGQLRMGSYPALGTAWLGTAWLGTAWLGTAWLGTALLFVCWLPGAVLAEESAEAFLDALRAEGYYDAALIYMDRMDGSPLVTTEFQNDLIYQRGVTLVQAATLHRDRATRERMLNEAKTSLEKFLAEQPESSKRVFARRQFVLLLREWAKMKVEAARRTNDDALMSEASGLYDEVFNASVSAVEELKSELSKLSVGGAGDGGAGGMEREEKEFRDSLRGEYLLTLLSAAESLEEKADTLSMESPERKALLNKATKRYEEMFGKYGGYLAGLRARLYQARSLRKLGDLDAALKLLADDLMSQTDNRPTARQLKTQALLEAIECWMDESKQDYPTVIAQGMPWLETVRPAESEEPDWILLRLMLARAHKQYSDEVAKRDPRDEIVKSSRDSARRLARAVSRLPSPYQEEGRMLLAEIPGGVSAARVGTQEPATTFEEARQRATDAISEMQSAQYFLDNVPNRLRTEKDEAVRKELQSKLKTAAETVEVKRGEAKRNLLLALGFAEFDTPMEDLNLVRRLLAFLHYAEGDYYDAAVMGEFVGRRFPGSASARLGARIALYAYLKLYENNPAETKEFESNQVASLANYIVETWSGTPEAAEAINTLIPFLIQQGRLEKAREYVENIPPDTVERGSAELRIGDALWSDYLAGMEQLREWEKAASNGGPEAGELKTKIETRAPELKEVRQTALEILEAGVERMRERGTANATVPRAVLALAQIYVDIDKAPRAIELLDDPKIGALPMIERGESVMESGQMREKAYRVALSAMVSALPKVKTTGERTALVERSQSMVQTLRDQIGDAPEDQKRMVDIFYSLARGLERQLQLLNKPEDRRVLSDGFLAFLEEVRGEAEDIRVLNWVAESFASLGKGLGTDAKSAAAARTCFLNAVSTYDQILGEAEQHDLTDELARQLQFRKAVAMRDAKQFSEASELIKSVLAKSNATLEYQKEAAMTYQLWAADPKEGIRYLTAVRGTKPDPQTNRQAVWGWSNVARYTQGKKQYRSDFFEARYNWSLCHYELAQRLRKESEKQQYMSRSKDVLVLTQRLYPTLGGSEWYRKYDALLRKVQRSSGERVVGLKKR